MPRIIFIFFSVFAMKISFASVDFSTISSDLMIEASSNNKCLSTRKTVIKDLLKLEVKSVMNLNLQNDLACLALAKNMKHEKTYRDYNVLWSTIMSPDMRGSKKITGKLKFSGLIKKPYRYTVSLNSEKQYDVTVRIHVKKWKIWKKSELNSIPKNKRTKHLERIFELTLSEAEKYWNNKELGINFHFIREPDAAKSDFSITLREHIRNCLYDKRWDWMPETDQNMTSEKIRKSFSFQHDSIVFAHEIGHMMGLEDEYSVWKVPFAFVFGFFETIFFPKREWDQLQADKWARGCDQNSIMCMDWSENVAPSTYHYYLILRRYFEKH